jgi:hypothetical protein
MKCEEYRTISLISHASKIMLKILAKRMEAKAKVYIGKTQYGFRKGCGTREAIAVLRILSERCLEYGNDLYICFVDFEKAFDRVNWIKMMEVLKKMGVDWKDRRLIRELYMKQDAIVRIDEGESDACIIGRGNRQGCLLSPICFLAYAETMMAEAMEGIDEGVKVGGELVTDVKFADDQGMVASTEEGLQKIMNKLNETAKNYDMKISVQKTKIMVISKMERKTANIKLEGVTIEQVKTFKYLGTNITEDGRSTQEIKKRIGMAKEAFNKRKELLSKKINKDLRKRMIKTLIWPVALYACETWSLRKEDRKRLNAFEMWVWRRMERVSWTERKTNEEVLSMIQESRQIVRIVIERKKKWIGHQMRQSDGGLLRDVIEGKMEGRRSVGRKRTEMLSELMEAQGYGEMKRRAEDRERWKQWTPRTCLLTEN